MLVRTLIELSGCAKRAGPIATSLSLSRIVADSAAPATPIADGVGGGEITFIYLRPAKHVSSAFETGILPAILGGQIVIDLWVSEVGMTRHLARRFAEKCALYIDAPIARMFPQAA
ncbi:NAD(P)-binding domain-containing protein [Bradyrhizobium sp. NAS96.2]|uniref:NAD(P)-binding domain-containing protein n=1 Tax=Bradyrhizobium sp. NAS96.2 TaxID=1680160 RepID=UPI000938D277|nr:NAD(P)-binding domain-containing protein [Bradyrhizobium sp. NAS96.2]